MCVVTSLASESFGFKRHIWDIPMTWLPDLQKLNFTFQILFSAASSTTKLSLLWFCKRLIGAGSKGLYRGYHMFLIGCMVFVGICWILFEIVSLAQCRYVHCSFRFFFFYSSIWRRLLTHAQANESNLGSRSRIPA